MRRFIRFVANFGLFFGSLQAIGQTPTPIPINWKPRINFWVERSLLWGLDSASKLRESCSNHRLLGNRGADLPDPGKFFWCDQLDNLAQ